MNAMDSLIMNILDNRGASSRPEIIKRVAIGTPRTTVYDALRRLMVRGLVVAEKKQLLTGEKRLVGRPIVVFTRYDMEE